MCILDGLGNVIDELRGGLAAAGISVRSFAPADLSAGSTDHSPMVLPGMTERDLVFLASIRHRLAEQPIVAAVDDLDGGYTFRAIRAGANRVLNSRIPVTDRIASLASLFEGMEPAAASLPAVFSDRESILLIQLLCGSETIPAIARRFYCSERSMHRRIRRVYDTFGVSGRTELRSFVSAYQETLYSDTPV